MVRLALGSAHPPYDVLANSSESARAQPCDMSLGGNNEYEDCGATVWSA
jgi:hypothetical protein